MTPDASRRHPFAPGPFLRTAWLGALAAVRQARRSPAEWWLTVLLGALGMSALAALAGFLYPALLRPPMAADPGDLFVIGRPPGITLVRPIDSVSRDDVGELRRLSGVATVSGYQWGGLDPDLSELAGVQPVMVDDNFFGVVGIPLRAGRGFLRSDVTGGPLLAVVSSEVWASLSHDADSPGDTAFEIAGSTVHVVGVAPPGFDVPKGANVWLLDQGTMVASDFRYLLALGRLATESARAAIHANGFITMPLAEHGRPDGTPVTLLLLVGAVCLLCSTWAQVGAYLASTAYDTNVDFVVLALGGRTRHRLVGPVCAGLLVAASATFVGGLGAAVFVQGLAALLPPPLVRLASSGAHAATLRALAVSGGLCVVTITAACIVVLAADRRAVRSPLSSRWRRRPATTRRHRTVILQMAATAALAYWSAIAIESYAALDSTHLGFDVSSVSEVRLSTGIPPDDVSAIRAEFLAFPGVRASCAMESLPLKRGRLGMTVSWAPSSAATDQQPVFVVEASQGCFDVLGIDLEAGRDIDANDVRHAGDIVVVSRSLLGPGLAPADAVGRSLYVGGHAKRIVGVAADVRADTVDGPVSPNVYLPATRLQVRWLVHTTRLIPDLGHLARTRLSAARGTTEVTYVRPMADYYAAAVASYRARAVVLSWLALTTAAVAILGSSRIAAGAIAHSGRDIALRLALGASPWRERRRLFLAHFTWGLLGAGLGCIGAVIGGAVLASWWSEVRAWDLHAAVASLAMTMAASALAAALPILRINDTGIAHTFTRTKS